MKISFKFLKVMKNKCEKNFKNDLESLHGYYPEDVLILIKENTDVLMEGYVNWQKALVDLTRKLDLDFNETNKIPSSLEQITLGKIKKKLNTEPKNKIFLGIAGPGAVGKETIKNSLGFDTVINTTTREKRDYEVSDIHYHFVSDIDFTNLEESGAFILSMNRKGRGKYGIQKKDVEEILNKSKIGVLEENPTNLTILRDYIMNHKDCDFILIYILPPFPVFLHLTARLALRCQKTGEDFRSVIDSTLGPRQLQELNSILDSLDKGVNVVFLVNDKVERVVEKIKMLVF